MDLPIIDWELSHKLAGNNSNHAKEFLELLNKELKKELPQLKKNLNNKAELKKRLHKLHGAISYSGLQRLKAAIIALENALKNNEDVVILFKQFEFELKQVLEISPPLS